MSKAAEALAANEIVHKYKVTEFGINRFSVFLSQEQNCFHIKDRFSREMHFLC